MPLYYSNSMKELNSYKIDKNGYINFSFIDKVYVKGLTVDEARELLQKTVNEYFKEATVVVKMVFYRISVLGEVQNPGTFMIDNKEINILQAISQAGGINTFGKRDAVKVIRKTNNGSKIYQLDLTDNGVLEADQFNLMPNDVVYVEPMKSKNVAFERIPYSIFLSMVSIGIAVYSIVK
jgi:polysaccharide export outer membrane protein